MRKMLPLLLLAICMGWSGCSDDDADEQPETLVGEWRLTERLADPGDGSGVFLPVNIDKRIWFLSNNLYRSKGSLCFMATAQDDDQYQGSYTHDGQIMPQGCNVVDYSVSYELNGEGDLVVSYPCIEPCREKYVRH